VLDKKLKKQNKKNVAKQKQNVTNIRKRDKNKKKRKKRFYIYGFKLNVAYRQNSGIFGICPVSS